MAEGLSELADTEDTHVGDIQQSVPPTAGGDAAELAGAVIQRSLETSTRAATATAERHLFAIAEISRLKRKLRHTSVWTLFGSAPDSQLC